MSINISLVDKLFKNKKAQQAIIKVVCKVFDGIKLRNHSIMNEYSGYKSSCLHFGYYHNNPNGINGSIKIAIWVELNYNTKVNEIEEIYSLCVEFKVIVKNTHVKLCVVKQRISAIEQLKSPMFSELFGSIPNIVDTFTEAKLLCEKPEEYYVQQVALVAREMERAIKSYYDSLSERLVAFDEALTLKEAAKLVSFIKDINNPEIDNIKESARSHMIDINMLGLHKS